MRDSRAAQPHRGGWRNGWVAAAGLWSNRRPLLIGRPLGLVVARARDGADRPRIQWLTADVAGHAGGRGVAAVSVLEQQRFTPGAEDPLVAPLTQRGEHWPQRTTLFGEDVVVAAAPLVVDAALEQARFHEGVETVGEDVARDAEPIDEVVEAAHTEEAVTQDQQRPPLTDDLESLGHRAVHVGERRLAHDTSVGELRDATQPRTVGCVTELTCAEPVSDFDRATAVVPTDRPGEFSVDLDPGWSSLVGVHGGYMCSLAVRGAESLATDRKVRTITTSFLHTGEVGPATLTVREVRRGRSASTMVTDLHQGDRLLITSRLTLLSPREGVEWSTPVRLDLPAREQCVRMEPGRVSHFQRVDGLLDPRSLPFSGRDRAMVRGYIRPLGDRRVDAAWLAMATDWFPPPAFVRLEPPTGGVSVDLTTHVHRPDLILADDEWLLGSFEVGNSTQGLAVEHGVIAAHDGTLVAESFQTRLTAT